MYTYKIECEYRDENVILKGDRALSKLITLLISAKTRQFTPEY